MDTKRQQLHELDKACYDIIHTQYRPLFKKFNKFILQLKRHKTKWTRKSLRKHSFSAGAGKKRKKLRNQLTAQAVRKIPFKNIINVLQFLAFFAKEVKHSANFAPLNKQIVMNGYSRGLEVLDSNDFDQLLYISKLPFDVTDILLMPQNEMTFLGFEKNQVNVFLQTTEALSTVCSRNLIDAPPEFDAVRSSLEVDADHGGVLNCIKASYSIVKAFQTFAVRLGNVVSSTVDLAKQSWRYIFPPKQQRTRSSRFRLPSSLSAAAPSKPILYLPAPCDREKKRNSAVSSSPSPSKRRLSLSNPLQFPHSARVPTSVRNREMPYLGENDLRMLFEAVQNTSSGSTR